MKKTYKQLKKELLKNKKVKEAYERLGSQILKRQKGLTKLGGCV